MFFFCVLNLEFALAFSLLMIDKGPGGGLLLLEALFDMYSWRLLLRMGQEDGLQETADRVARAKFSKKIKKSLLVHL